jgi:hypothetical protein
MSKTISINPDLFKVTNTRSSRKKKGNTPGQIKIKNPRSNKRDKTLRKNHVLRFIREQQEKNYKQLLEGDKPKSTLEKPVDDSFNNDFDESLKYLMTLTEEKESNESKNKTIKNRQSTDSVLYYPGIAELVTNEDVNLEFPFPLDTPVPQFQLSTPTRMQPVYGCLKNGTLPTWRTYNRTQKAHHGGSDYRDSKSDYRDGTSDGKSENRDGKSGNRDAAKEEKEDKPIQPVTGSSSESIRDYMKRSHKKSEIKQTTDLLAKKDQKMKYPKQKRTIRRTFKVGKSKVLPKISVLISNKTLRNRVTEKTHALKETPIHEVKRYLTKKGFIRVGSIAPNDVLRKMYESATLICGEIENHNPDNLLFNFLNDMK